MLTDFQSINNSLTQDLLEQAKAVFESQLIDGKYRSLQKLPQMLHQMKIQIPQTMLKELNRCLGTFPTPKFTFKAWTHYVARATLEQQLEDEIRNLFYHIDKNKTGTVDAQDILQFLKQMSGGQKMGEEEVNHLVKQMDWLKVGYLNYEDFVYLLLPK